MGLPEGHKLRRVEKGRYDVVDKDDLIVGSIFKDPEAWTRWPWLVEGRTGQFCYGGPGQSECKAAGFKTLKEAAESVVQDKG